MSNLNGQQIAMMFKALGEPTRLRIFEFLRSCSGPVALEEHGEVRPFSGATVGEVCCQLTGVEKATPAISHHLKELRNAGLITSERRGKFMVCAVNPEAIEALGAYFGGKYRPDDLACLRRAPKE